MTGKKAISCRHGTFGVSLNEVDEEAEEFVKDMSTLEAQQVWTVWRCGERGRRASGVLVLRAKQADEVSSTQTHLDASDL